MLSDQRRFKEKTKQMPNGCVVWTAAYDAAGYGRFWYKKKMMPAHQAAYRLFVGEYEGRLEVRHLCNNSACVEVTHLMLGTHAENMHDKALAGDHPNQKINFAEAREMRRTGKSLSDIARHFGATPQAVFQGLKRNYGTQNFEL